MTKTDIPILTQSRSLNDSAATATFQVVERVDAVAKRLGFAVDLLPPSSPQRRKLLREQRDNQVDDGLLFLILTGGSERSTLKEVRTSGVHSVGLVAHSEFNSLPAALEIGAYLGQMGVAVQLVQLCKKVLEKEGYDDDAADFRGLLQAFGARRQLRRVRLGVLGDPSPWLLTSQQLDEDRIQEDWGVELVHMDMSKLRTEIEQTSPTDKEVQSIADEIVRSADIPLIEDLEDVRRGKEDGGGTTTTSCCGYCGAHGVTPEHVTQAARVYKALDTMVQQNQVTAFTIRCFDLLETPVIAGCLGVSLMNDRGIVAGCEGDVHAAITMLMAQLFVHKASFMANPVEIDAKTGRVLLCHCTIARTLCSSYMLDSHFESDLSVSITGKLNVTKNTIVTIARVDAMRNLVFAAEGTVDSTYRQQPNQCRTQVMVQLAPTDAQTILERPLGNHHVLIVGACATAFHAFAKLFLPTKK